MMWKLKQKKDDRPPEISIKTFAFLPVKLYYADDSYIVWLGWYWVDYHLRGGIYLCNSEYPLFVKPKYPQPK